MSAIMKRTARIAGLLYLLVAITGAFSIMYVPETLIVRDDAAATARNIASSELLFRAGIAGALICQVTFIFLVLMLYRLFKDVDNAYATTMVALVIAAVPIAFLNTLNHMAALILTSGADFLSAFTGDQQNALVMTFLTLHEHGLSAVEIFWGLWLFPFGVLVIKSSFLPRVLGVLLIVACFAYLADSAVSLLVPQYNDAINPFTAAAGGIGEFGILLWLLIKGVKTEPATLAPQPAFSPL